MEISWGIDAVNGYRMVFGSLLLVTTYQIIGFSKKVLGVRDELLQINQDWLHFNVMYRYIIQSAPDNLASVEGMTREYWEHQYSQAFLAGFLASQGREPAPDEIRTYTDKKLFSTRALILNHDYLEREKKIRHKVSEVEEEEKKHILISLFLTFLLIFL